MLEDLLSWLIPGAPAEELAALRRVVMALRLLRTDAHVPADRRAGPSWWRVRSELERLQRRERRSALEGVLHAYLSALRSADSFLDLGPPPMEYAVAWRGLLAEGEGRLLPRPTETPAQVVDRLLAAGEARGGGTSWRAWWSACSAHVLEPAAAERRWEALLGAELAPGASPAWRARFAAGLAAARLERFEPARALALHSSHADLARHDPALRRLLGWSALLCGDAALARALLLGLAPPAGPLPRSLAELRADVPAWAELLQGTEPDALPGDVALPRGRERAAFGGVLLAILARRSGGELALVALDARAALRAQAEKRLGAPGWGATTAWRPEPGAIRRLHRAPDATRPLAMALAGEGVRALVQAAIAGDGSGVRAWLQLECEHHLLPSAACLAALARAWRDTVPGEARATRRVESPRALGARPLAADDPRREFVAALFAALGTRPAAWSERARNGEDRVHVERGRASDDPAAARGVREACERRAPVRCGQDARDPDAACALPLCEGGTGRVLGVLLLGAEPRTPLADGEVAAAQAVLRALEPLWWATTFRAASRARDGGDLAWDPARRFLAALEPAVRAAACARTPFLLVGEPGSGRRTLARWLHFRGPDADSPCVEGLPENEEQPPGERPGGAPGTRVLDLDELERETQVALARASAGGVGERFLFLARAPVHVLRERRMLAPELERCTDPLPLSVPPLRERRDEIPALIGVLAGNVARRETLACARFEDEAIGALWRQDWRGGVAELAALVAQLARAHAGHRAGAAEVRAAFHSRRLAFRERLPSRRPRAQDVADALAVTRHRSGGENRARAARYLGWDPDTLAARLRPEAEDDPSNKE